MRADMTLNVQQQRNATLYALSFLAGMCVALNELNSQSQHLNQQRLTK